VLGDEWTTKINSTIPKDMCHIVKRDSKRRFRPYWSAFCVAVEGKPFPGLEPAGLEDVLFKTIYPADSFAIDILMHSKDYVLCNSKFSTL